MSNTSLLGSYGDNSGSALMFRNRISNGDMRIDQRNAGAAVTPADETYTLDRWSVRKVGAGNFSIQQRTTQSGATNFESGSAPSGFTHSIKVTTTAQDSVMDASDVYALVQAFEGLNVGDLGWGTSSAQTITLSFWVKSSFAGVYGIGVSNPNTDAGYSALYTINSANTWEYKTIVIAGPTFGTFKTDNTASFRVAWSLGCGSARSIAPNSWVASNSFGATGQVNFMGQSTGATLYITGVQLEAGPTATPFERRPIGTELALCQRYYEKSYDIAVAPGTATPTGTARVHAQATSNYISCYISFKQTKQRSGGTTTLYNPNGTSGVWLADAANIAFITSSVGQSGMTAHANNAQTTVNQFISGHWTIETEL